MFTSIGINLDIVVICLIAIILVLITTLIIVIINSIKLRRIMKNCSLGDLDKTIITYYDNVEALSEELKQTLTRFEIFDSNMLLGAQKMAALRYDAFNDGSSLSHCIALLDGCDNGFVLTSIFGRSVSNTYLKIIQDGTCNEQLASEEAQVIKAAQDNYRQRFKK